MKFVRISPRTVRLIQFHEIRENLTAYRTFYASVIVPVKTEKVNAFFGLSRLNNFKMQVVSLSILLCMVTLIEQSLTES